MSHMKFKRSISIIIISLLIVIGISFMISGTASYAETNPVLSGPVTFDIQGKQYVSWDSIYFGHSTFHQNDENNTESYPIRWRVLSVNGNDALLLADKCLEKHQYQDTDIYPGPVDWKSCTLRDWMNNTFIDTIFTDEEQSAIIDTYISGSNNDPDKLFLLSEEEILSDAYQASASPGASSYWLRSEETSMAKIVFNVEETCYIDRQKVSNTQFVRPAIHLDLSSSVWTYAGRKGTNKCGDDVYFDFDEDTGTLTLSGSGNTMDNLSYPFPWEQWDNRWNNKIKKVVMGEGITDIGAYLFSNCSELKELILPTTLESISERAFSQCTSLEQVLVPVNCISIGYWAFDGCTSLKKIDIPEKCVFIYDGAFDGCTSLKMIDIPEKCEFIYDGAFSRCTSLEKLNIKGQPYIGGNAFADCSSLKHVTMNGASITGREAFKNCSSLSHIVLTWNTKAVNEDAFEGCSPNLTIDAPTGSAGFDYARHYRIPVTHNFGEWEIVTEATDYTAGLKERTCSDCGEVEKEIIPQKVSLEQLAGRIDSLSNELAAAKKELSDAESKLADAEKKLNDLEKSASDSDKTIAEQNAKIVELEKTSAEMEVNRIEAEKKLAEFEISIGNLETGAAESAEKIAELGQQITALEEANAALKEANDALSKACSEAGTKFDEIDSRIEKLESGVEETGKRNAELEQQIAALEEANATLKASNEALNKANAEAETKLADTAERTVPLATAITKATASKRTVTLKWNKTSNITGYQIQYSTKKNFSSAYKIITISKQSASSKKIKKLKAKKNYYFRIRTYKTLDGKKYFSDWSKVKKKKTK